jgi:hypothetical protein
MTPGTRETFTSLFTNYAREGHKEKRIKPFPRNMTRTQLDKGAESQKKTFPPARTSYDAR